LDERGRRLVAAAEAFAAGYGGIAAGAMATGMAPSTIGRGLKELARMSRPRGFGGRGRGASRRFARACPRESGGPVPAGGSRGAGRTNDPRGSGIAVAVDLPERAPAGAGAAGVGPPSDPHAGRRIAQWRAPQ